MIDTGTWHMKGLKIMNTAPNYSKTPLKDFRRAVEGLNSEMINQKPLITHEYEMEEASEALEEISDHRPNDYIKGYFRFT